MAIKAATIGPHTRHDSGIRRASEELHDGCASGRHASAHLAVRRVIVVYSLRLVPVREPAFALETIDDAPHKRTRVVAGQRCSAKLRDRITNAILRPLPVRADDRGLQSLARLESRLRRRTCRRVQPRQRCLRTLRQNIKTVAHVVLQDVRQRMSLWKRTIVFLQNGDHKIKIGIRRGDHRAAIRHRNNPIEDGGAIIIIYRRRIVRLAGVRESAPVRSRPRRDGTQNGGAVRYRHRLRSKRHHRRNKRDDMKVFIYPHFVLTFRGHTPP